MATIYLDIETVPEYSQFSDMPLDRQELYKKKFARDIDQESQAFIHYEYNASFFAEFSKVVCVCLGGIKDDTIRLTSLCSFDNEKLLLQKLGEKIDGNEVRLCAHNGLEFDFPFLMRRYIINGMPLPGPLNTFGQKPWETRLEDTLKLWSGTAWNYKASLDLICNVLGIESPKQDFDGSQIAGLIASIQGDPMKETEAISTIVRYCYGDVVALIKVWCRLFNKSIPTEIVYT